MLFSTVCKKKNENESRINQSLVKSKAKMWQKLDESGAKIRQFGGYNVQIIQDYFGILVK